MIGWICLIFIFCGVVCGIVTGETQPLSDALLETPRQAVSLLLGMGGSICFFCGLIRVAQAAGLVETFSRSLSRPVGFLIPKTKGDPELRSLVTMNLASNFFGLGNAATPYGIQASARMSGGISRSLAAFLLLNTCSVQLIPTTVCALRQANGAKNAMDILPAVWIVQVLSCTFGILLTRLFFREEK